MSAGRSCEWLESLSKVWEWGRQERKSSSPGEKFQVLVTGDLFASSLWRLAKEDWEKTLLQERTDSRKGTFLCIFAFQVFLWPTSCLNYTCLHSSSNRTSYGKKEGQVIIRSRSQTWFSAQDHVRVELKPPKTVTESEQF